MATVPSIRAETEIAIPTHQMAVGLASRAPSTSRVTSAGVLLPAMSGTLAMTAASAIVSPINRGARSGRSARVALRVLRSLRRTSRLPHELQVPDGRLGIELVEHAVGALACRERGHAAARVVKIAKDDRLRRTRLLARGLDRSVRERLTQAERF